MEEDANSSYYTVSGKQRKIKDFTNFGCVCPRSILSRCFWWIKSSKGRRIVAKSNKVERETRREKVLDGCSVNGLNGESSSIEGSVLGVNIYSGQYRMQASFNLAVGFGLVYLTTTIKNELNKMTELRTQMEMLLQNVKEALQSQKREAHSETSELNANLACATSDTQVGMDNLSFVDNLADSENVSVFAQSFNCITTRQEKCAEEMDQLEAELEDELERMQIHLDSELMSNHPEERRLEMAIEGTAPGGSLSASFGEVIDRPDSRSKGQGGVSPNELEIRLHELLEARQEQRIKELQANLEQAKRKLLEKETEVSWWKDTAQAVYPRLSKTPHLSRREWKFRIGTSK